jgi:hypothetical protein
MNYISLETNNLVVLVGRKNGKIDWAEIGTNSDLINLDELKISTYKHSTSKIFYLLPISDLDAANSFKTKCLDMYGIEVSILNNADALSAREAFLASIPTE